MDRLFVIYSKTFDHIIIQLHLAFSNNVNDNSSLEKKFQSDTPFFNRLSVVRSLLIS